MDAISFFAPINIKKIYIDDSEQILKPQYLVCPKENINENFNIYLTIISPNIVNKELTIDSNNIILIYSENKSLLNVDTITKQVLLTNLEKFIEKNLKKEIKTDFKTLNTINDDLISNWPDKCNKSTSINKDNWISKKYNKKFVIYDVLPDGNCFFYSFIKALKFKDSSEINNNIQYIPEKIIDVFKNILTEKNIIFNDVREKIIEISNNIDENNCSKYNYSVLALRYIISLNVDEDIFMLYKTRYDPNDYQEKSLYELLNKESFTIEEFKNYILTDNFWADEWVISILQNLFNIQFIFFDNSKKEVENCGITGNILNKSTLENPIKIILINWTGNSHYQLVTYNDDALLDIINLPEFILDKCKPSAIGGKKYKKTTKKNINKNILRKKIVKTIRKR